MTSEKRVDADCGSACRQAVPTRREVLLVTLGALVSMTAISAPAEAMPYTPQGEERKAILDALRVTVAEALGAPIEFVVEKIAASGEWAFALVTPRRPGGAPIAWEKTVCAGDVSYLVGGLMRKNGTSWSVAASAICPTDVAWSEWPKDYGAPAEIFD